MRKLEMFLASLTLAFTVFVGCVLAEPAAPVARCRDVSVWTAWLRDLQLTGSWDTIGKCAAGNAETARLNDEVTITTLEAVQQPSGICDCCVVLNYRKGQLESIALTRTDESVDALEAIADKWLDAIGGIPAADRKRIRRDLKGQMRSSDRGDIRRDVDLPIEERQRRSLIVHISVLRDGPRRFGWQLTITFIRLPVD